MLLAGSVIFPADASASSANASNGSDGHVASASLVVNPLYQQAYQVAFGAAPPCDASVSYTGCNAHAPYSGVAGITPDDGIVFARLFIPAPTAAGGHLLGDNRGFSPTPGASSRGVLAWNTRTGQVSLTVSHSTLVTRNHAPITALPISKLSMTADFHQDQPRLVNEVGFGSNSRSNDIQAQLSLLNPLTNPGFGAWSADYTLTIKRMAANTYRLTQLQGNGYPAIEAYYYPHYIPANAPQADIIAKRSVDPLFTNRWIDPGGGLAAVDYLSWNRCRYLPGSLTVQCTNTAPYDDSGQFPWLLYWARSFAALTEYIALLGINVDDIGLLSLPSQAQWTTPWETPPNAIKAM